MILELDDFCAKVAPKLLRLIPYMTDCLEKRKIALENGEEFCGGVILIEGSRGCVHGDTLIDTDCGKIKIKDFHGGYVRSWTGNAFEWVYASGAVKYAPKMLYKITFEDGRDIITTDNHYVLSGSSFLPVSQLSTDSLPFGIVSDDLHQTHYAFDPCSSATDARHLIGTILNCLYRCWLDSRLCGAQLRSGPDTYLDIVPLLTDAQISNGDALSHLGGLWGLLRKYVRACQSADRPSTLAVLPEAVVQCLTKVDSYICEEFSGLLDGFCQESGQSVQSYNLHDITHQLLLRIQDMLIWISRDKNLSSILGLSSFAFDDNSFTDSFDCNGIEYSHECRIASIEEYGVEEYYDIFVPYYHNYTAHGLIHHNSGKTQGMIRIVGQLLMNGYADAATIGIITEKSLDESVCALFTNVFDEHIDWPSVRTGDMYYPLQDGGEVFFKGFHPSRGSALKTNERAKDILFVDEVENWKGGASATLNTYIRACGLIILVSNHFSQDVKDWAKAFNAQYVRIDYWENPALPKYVLDGWNQLKVENYDLWRATIMYDDTDQFKRIITDAEIFSCFDPYTPAKAYRVGVMGIDVAIGGGDCSVMCCAYLDQRDHIVLDIRDGTKAETMGLIGSVVLNKAKWRANFEIWDGDGQGKAVIQSRAPGTNAERQQKGIFEFHGGIGGNQTWGDNRTMGYGTLAQFAREGRLHFVGDRNALEKLQEDLRSQILTDPRKYGQVQLAKKEQIKKILGRSPDYSDSAMMAVWFLVHKAMKEYGGVQHEDHTYKKALQVVNNSRYNTRK